MPKKVELESECQSKLQKKLNRGFICCYAVAAICVTRAALSYQDLLEAGAWLVGAVYFFLAPSSLRRGVERRRILIGMLSVLLVMLSLAGAMSVVAGAINLYSVVSLATVIAAGPLVAIFGYNQEIASHIRSLNSKGEEHAEPEQN